MLTSYVSRVTCLHATYGLLSIFSQAVDLAVSLLWCRQSTLVAATAAMGQALLIPLTLFFVFLSLAVSFLSSRSFLSCLALSRLVSFPVSCLVSFSCLVMCLLFVLWRWLGDGAGQDSVRGGIRAVLPKKTAHPQQRDQHDHLTPLHTSTCPSDATTHVMNMTIWRHESRT